MIFLPRAMALFLSGASIVMTLLAGCTETPGSGGGDTEAHYLGSAACSACHPSVAALHANHGHRHALKLVQGTAPTYPGDLDHATDPPAGYAWGDIAYVIDGYLKAARFVDTQGFVLTDGTTGVNSQYVIAQGPVQILAGYAAYLPNQAAPLAFDYDLFRYRTTGAESFDDNGGMRQDNRPGVGGTWFEAGVQCEACHGPGSLHVPNPPAGNINLGTDACSRCHANADEPGTIAVADGLILSMQQSDEVAASPHAGFACTICHNPHASATTAPDTGLRNRCQNCHSDYNMAVHEGVVFTRGDYSETVSCESCHMPFAVKETSSTTILATNGQTIDLGDTRSHIIRIDTNVDAAGMFSANGSEVKTDADGRAGMSSCYVCLRCHNGLGNAFAFPADEACNLGRGLHGTRE